MMGFVRECCERRRVMGEAVTGDGKVVAMILLERDGAKVL